VSLFESIVCLFVAVGAQGGPEGGGVSVLESIMSVLESIVCLCLYLFVVVAVFACAPRGERGVWSSRSCALSI